MERHKTDDWMVVSEGTARVFGYRDLEASARCDWADDMHDAAYWDAEDLHRPSARRDIQVCAVVGVPCELCDGPATGYFTIPDCDCRPGGCKVWVCPEHG